VAAAKQYIENHYKSQMKSLQERKERWVWHLNFETGVQERNLAQFLGRIVEPSNSWGRSCNMWQLFLSFLPWSCPCFLMLNAADDGVCRQQGLIALCLIP
jgi:hypothetical protein